MVEYSTFPDELGNELQTYFRNAIKRSHRVSFWTSSDVSPKVLAEGVVGLNWRLMSASGMSLNVILDPRRLPPPASVPNSSKLSDLAWVISILAQEHILSYDVCEFADGEEVLLKNQGRTVHRR